MRPLSYAPVQVLLVLYPACEGLEPLILRPCGPSHGLNKGLPLLVGANLDGAPGVVAEARIDVVGSAGVAEVASGLRYAAVQKVVQIGNAHQVCGRLNLGDLHVLAFAGPLAPLQGRHNRQRREGACDKVRVAAF